jgi:hypothetical protein
MTLRELAATLRHVPAVPCDLLSLTVKPIGSVLGTKSKSRLVILSTNSGAARETKISNVLEYPPLTNGWRRKISANSASKKRTAERLKPLFSVNFWSRIWT